MIYASANISVESFGYYGLAILWLQYLFLISPGLISAASREVPIHDKTDKSYSDELLSAAVFYETAFFLIQIFFMKKS